MLTAGGHRGSKESSRNISWRMNSCYSAICVPQSKAHLSSRNGSRITMVSAKQLAQTNAAVDIGGERALVSGGTQGIGAG